MSSRKVCGTNRQILWRPRRAQPRKPVERPKRDQVNPSDIWETFSQISSGWKRADRLSQPMYGAPFGFSGEFTIIISDKITKNLAPDEILKLHREAPQKINPPMIERLKIDHRGRLRFTLDLSENKNIYLDRELTLEIHLIIQGKQNDKDAETVAGRVFCLESPLNPDEYGFFYFKKDINDLHPEGRIPVTNVEIPRDAIFFFVS